MYKLIRISEQNWYLNDLIDIDVDESTAVIGATGTGKSSLVDAIQTVISGNSRRYLELNAAAGSSKTRSVKSYIQGNVSDVNQGRPRRDHCESCLALTFYQEKTKKFLTIGLLFSISDAPDETTKRFVMEGVDFKISDYTFKDGDSVFSLPHPEMIEKMKRTADGKFSTYPSAKLFVEGYLQIVRPKQTPHYQQFLRSFFNGIKARELTDTSQFVRNCLLTPQNIDFKNVKEKINTWREISSKLEELKAKKDLISDATAHYKRGLLSNAETIAKRYVETGIQKKKTEIQSRELQEQHDVFETELNDCKNEIEKFETTLKQQTSALRDLEEKIRANSSDTLKDIESKIRVDEEEILYLEASILPTLQELKSTKVDDIEAMALISELSDHTEINNTTYELVARLSNAISTLKDTYSGRINELKNQITELQNELENLTNTKNKVQLSPAALTFKNLLKNASIPNKCLSETIKIKNREWSFAVESVLGRNKEAFLFQSATDERRAFEIMKNNRDQLHQCVIVSAEHYAKIKDNHSDQSLAGEVITSHPTAKKFISKEIGYISKAESADEMFKTPFSITTDGEGNWGGKLSVKKKFISTLKSENSPSKYIDEIQNKINEEIDTLTSKLEASTDDNLQVLSGIDFTLLLSEISQIDRRFKKITSRKKEIAAINAKNPEQYVAELISEKEEKLNQINATRERLNTFNKTEKRLIADKAAKLTELKEQEKKIKSSQDDHRLAAEAIQNPKHVELCKALDRLDLEEKNLEPLIHNDKAFQGENIIQNADRALNIARSKLSDFDHQYEPRSPLRESGGNDSVVLLWCVKMEKHLTFDQLAKQTELLQTKQKEMELALKENLLVKLSDSFALMNKQIDTVNNKLATFKFVGQQYSFTQSVNPKLKSVYDLVVAISEDISLGEDPATKENLLELEELLMNDEDNIKLLEDYRNYFQFDINVQSSDPDTGAINIVKFSEVMGKLSGGQRQAPYYAAVAAAMSSAYYPNAKEGDDNGLGIVVFDEAFDKLDIPNTQRLIHLFESLNLQVIVAAPEEKRNSLIECVKSIISIQRLPSSSDLFIDTEIIGRKARDAMLSENPIHKSVEEFS